MLSFSDRYKKWGWLFYAALLGVSVVGIAIGYYCHVAANSPAWPQWPRGGTDIGLIYGAIGAAIIAFEMLYWVRKKFRARLQRVSTRTWLRVHIWLGLVCVPIVVMHTGFKLGSPLTTALAVVFGLVIASGIYGVYMQWTIPKKLLQEVPCETIHSQIAHVAEQHAWDAEDMVLAICGPDPKNRSHATFPNRRKSIGEGAVVKKMRRVGATRGVVVETRRAVGLLVDGTILRDQFYDVVADYLMRGRKSTSKLVDQTYVDRFFADLRGATEPEAKTVIDSLEDLCRQRRDYDRQSDLFFTLHSWLWWHLPLSVALVVLLVGHVFAAWRYY